MEVFGSSRHVWAWFGAYLDDGGEDKSKGDGAEGNRDDEPHPTRGATIVFVRGVPVRQLSLPLPEERKNAQHGMEGLA